MGASPTSGPASPTPKLGPGIAPDEVSLVNFGGDLELFLYQNGLPTGDNLTVKGWFNSTAARTEFLEFAGGLRLSATDIMFSRQAA